MALPQVNYDATYACIKAISEMNTHFSAFDEQYESPNENAIKRIVSGPAWGQYYDAATLAQRDTCKIFKNRQAANAKRQRKTNQ